MTSVRALTFREVHRKSQKLSPYEKMVEKQGEVALHNHMASFDTPILGQLASNAQEIDDL